MKKQKVLRVLNKQELDQLKSIDSDFYKWLMIVLENTGLRISELVSLNVKDVTHNGSDIRLTIKIVGKGKKERTIPLNQKAKEGLYFFLMDSKHKMKNIWNPNDPIIVSQKRHRMSREHISREIKKIGEALNFDSPVTPHTLRHQFATTLIRKGCNLKDVQSLLGHSNIKTTLDIYTHSDSESLLEAVNLLN